MKEKFVDNCFSSINSSFFFFIFSLILCYFSQFQMHPTCPRFVTVVEIIQLSDNRVLAILLSQPVLEGLVFCWLRSFCLGFKIVWSCVCNKNVTNMHSHVYLCLRAFLLKSHAIWFMQQLDHATQRLLAT